MSKRHKRDREPAGDDGLWVRSDLGLDGTYVVSVSAGGDRAWVLDRPAATAYCLAVMDAAQRAEYDAAVLRLLTRKLGLPLEEAGLFVARELRPDRPPVDDAATAPLRFVPGVSQRTGEGFLALWLDDEQIGQLDPGPAKEHAIHLLDTLAAADLDQALHRALTTLVELDDDRARAVVDDLANWRKP